MKKLTDKLKLSLKDISDFLFVSHNTLRTWLHRGQMVREDLRPHLQGLENYAESIQPYDLAEIALEFDEAHTDEDTQYRQEALEKITAALAQAREQLKKLETQRVHAFRKWHLYQNLIDFLPEEIPDTNPQKRGKAVPLKADMVLVASVIAKPARLHYRENFPYSKYLTLKQKIVGLEAERAFLEGS